MQTTDQPRSVQILMSRYSVHTVLAELEAGRWTVAAQQLENSTLIPQERAELFDTIVAALLAYPISAKCLAHVAALWTASMRGIQDTRTKGVAVDVDSDAADMVRALWTACRRDTNARELAAHAVLRFATDAVHCKFFLRSRSRARPEELFLHFLFDPRRAPGGDLRAFAFRDVFVIVPQVQAWAMGYTQSNSPRPPTIRNSVLYSRKRTRPAVPNTLAI